MPNIHRYTRNQKGNVIFDCHNYGIIVESREIFLFDEGDGEINQSVVGRFIKNILLLNNINSQPITVHLMSVGGEWAYGIAIYDIILLNNIKKECGDINIVVHGCAYSMGSIILQAAKQRMLMPNSEVHLHYGDIEYGGNTLAFLSEAKRTQNILEKMLDIYVSRCYKAKFWKQNKITQKEQIKNFFREKINSKQEMYLTADEAIKLGLADKIVV